MTTKKQSRTAAAQKTSLDQKYSSLQALIKALIVRMALDGVLPFCIADWLIQHGGLRHV